MFVGRPPNDPAYSANVQKSDGSVDLFNQIWKTLAMFLFFLFVIYGVIGMNSDAAAKQFFEFVLLPVAGIFFMPVVIFVLLVGPIWLLKDIWSADEDGRT